MLKSIAGTGDMVAGFEREFALEPGMVAEVREDVAAKWVAAGIARSVDEPEPENEAAAAGAGPEAAKLRTPEKAVRKRPSARGRGKRSGS